MSFRLLNNFPVYLGNDSRPLFGGELRFYDSGTTTPKSVFGDPDLTIDNGPVVELDAAGRTVHDIWGSGSYRVRLYAADGTLVAEADDVEIPGGTAATIPALVDGYFLTNNGALMLWAPVRQLPDPTGQDGKMVVADGDGYILVSPSEPPDPPEPDIEVGDSFLRVENYYRQWGTGSAPATNTDRTSVSIAFPEAFDAAPHFVGVTVTSTNITGHSLVAIAVTGITATGCVVTFDNADRHYTGSSKIVNPIPFQWVAEGKKAA